LYVIMNTTHKKHANVGELFKKRAHKSKQERSDSAKTNQHPSGHRTSKHGRWQKREVKTLDLVRVEPEKAITGERLLLV